MRPESPSQEETCKSPLSELPGVCSSAEALTLPLPEVCESPSPSSCPHFCCCPDRSHHASPSDE